MFNNSAFTIERTTLLADYVVCASFMVTTDPWIQLGMNYDQCLKAFEGDFKEVYILKNDTSIIGFVIIQTQGTFKGYIQTLCISEKYRGQQWGTQLLQFAEVQILKYSPNVFICVSSFNAGAIRLYTRMGFELVGELRDFIKSGFTELLFRKTVGPVSGYTNEIP